MAEIFVEGVSRESEAISVGLSDIQTGQTRGSKEYQAPCSSNPCHQDIQEGLKDARRIVHEKTQRSCHLYQLPRAHCATVRDPLGRVSYQIQSREQFFENICGRRVIPDEMGTGRKYVPAFIHSFIDGI